MRQLQYRERIQNDENSAGKHFKKAVQMLTCKNKTCDNSMFHTSQNI